MRVPKRTRIAKKIFWASGKLSKIRTPQRTYAVLNVDPDATDPDKMMTLGPAKVSWLSCRLSMRLLKWSMRLDWKHWDHWALVHEHCDPVPCAQCNGCVCQWEDDDEDPGSTEV